MGLKTSTYFTEQNDRLFEIAENECHISKETTNSVLYYIRQEYFRLQQIYKDKITSDPEYKKETEDYLNLVKLEKEIYHILINKPRIFIENGVHFINYAHDIQRHVLQNLIRLVIRDFNSFFGLLRKGSIRANIPGYKRSKFSSINYGAQDFTIKYFIENANPKIQFLKKTELIKLTQDQRLNLRAAVFLSTKRVNSMGEIKEKSRYIVLEKGILVVNEVRITPEYNRFKIEVIYDQEKQSIDRNYHLNQLQRKIANDPIIKQIKKENKEFKTVNQDNKGQIKINKSLLEKEVKKRKEEDEKEFKLAKVKDRSIKKFKNNLARAEEPHKNTLVLDAGVDNVFTMIVIDEQSPTLKSAKIKLDMYQDVAKYYPQIEQSQKELDLFIDQYYKQNVEKDFLKKEAEKNKQKKQEISLKAEDSTPARTKPKGWFLATKTQILHDTNAFPIFSKLNDTKQCLWDHRDRRNRLFNHLCSNQIIKFAIANNCNLIIFGKNNDMKQKMDGVPLWQRISHSLIMNMVKNKCEEFGIQVEFQDESYTSKTSFFDDEEFAPNSAISGVRNGRWFTRTNGKIYDADVHACLNIYKKYMLSNNKEIYKNLVRIRVQDSKSLNIFDNGLKNFCCGQTTGIMV